ncbi:hypothetical protein [Streptomyces sp. A012304]|uniref:hypothetical protein n=1 Tax=Streptomyces sp. A012304 TaxID=375446 RepID=UPI002230E842|nr:hypothetical protein [Streptomyces sp. A012304]GKQ36907.1 hypothetical protein ALMP_34470 [Streptomyces sp. A012304]
MNAGFVNAAEMLAVPKAARLARARVTGQLCVWCGKTPEMGIGPRLSVIDGVLQRWLPRACQSCASREAARVYGIHIRTCPRCSHRDYCPDSRALHALAQPCR